jgi:hypothetical protein
MTAARRLAALESSLQPLDVVLRVLADAQAYASLDAYARAVAEVPVESAPLAKVSLPYALDRIQDDPHEAEKRMRRHDGAWVDYGAEGLLIAYHVVEPDRIRLLDVADVKKEHRW